MAYAAFWTYNENAGSYSLKKFQRIYLDSRKTQATDQKE